MKSNKGLIEENYKILIYIMILDILIFCKTNSFGIIFQIFGCQLCFELKTIKSDFFQNICHFFDLFLTKSKILNFEIVKIFLTKEKTKL